MSTIFYSDEAMTKPIMAVKDLPRLSFVHREGIATGDAVIYVGYPDPLIKVVPTPESGASEIVLSVVDALPDWAASKVYVRGALLEPSGGNGYMYKCTKAGSSDAVAPSIWPIERGAVVNSGTAEFTNLGPRFAALNVKLAKSQAGLDTASGGGSISFGAEIIGSSKASTPVYIRVSNTSAAVRSDETQPSLRLRLTESEFVENF